MEQKTVEQIAAEKYPFRDFLTAKSDAGQSLIVQHNRAATLQRLGFIDGYTTAQQSQPMWREIEGGGVYFNAIVRNDDYVTTYSTSGRTLLSLGYTHYLSSEDLLKLPTEKK